MKYAMRILLLLLVLSLCLAVAGCKEDAVETAPTTEPATDPATEPVETEPIEEPPEETEEPPYSIPAGIMKPHANGANGNTGIYFTMEPNDVPADSTWKTEFRPVTASAVQLYRDGEVYNVANYMTGMIVKYSDTDYYLKTEEWANRKYFPLQSGDVLKIEGDFSNATLDVRFTIDTTYILYEEGLVFFGTEYPDDSVGAKVIEVGPFTEHPNGMNPNGFYACAPENSAPATDWSVEYKAVSEDVIQLIRGGKTYNVGNPAAGRLIKYNDTDYFIKMEQWIIKDLYPLQDGDIVKIEGNFANSATGILMKVKRTYIAVNQGMVAYSSDYPTELPTANLVDAGVMSKHPEKGWTSTAAEAGRLYFSMESNDAPYSDGGVRFTPRAETNVKLIRDGVTYTVGHTARETIVKISDTGYIFEFWVLADHKPVRDGDILVVEGEFINSDTRTILKIDKTYVAMNEGLAAFSTTYPTEMPKANVVDAGVMEKHPEKGWTSSKEDAGRLYFTMAPNDAPYDANGVRYVPNEEACVKLIRDGVTYTVGHKARETIVKLNETDYIFEFWVLADHKPVRDGDILLVEGKFTNAASGTVLNISKTYVAMNEGLAAFSTEYPTEMPKSNVIEAGVMQKHPTKGWTSSTADPGRLYFTMAENDAPYDASGVRYVPNEEACVKLIRDGVTYTVGHKARETIVKLNATDYIFEFWVLADHKPVKDGDILIVEGKFTNAASGTVINISKTYVAMNAGMAEFSTEYPEGPVGPEMIQGGTLQTHPEGWVQGENGGMYFRLNNNDAPFDSEWSLLYSPTSAGNVKLIRDGITYEVANPAAEMITKYRENDYYLAFWPIPQKPIVDGDILVIEGSFVNVANNVAIEIEKSYVVFENGQATIVDSLTTEINAGYMQTHPNGWNSSSNDGLYFKLSANDVPYDGWNVEYEPASAASIQLVRGGQTYNIGQPGKGTIVKYNNTDYYLKLAKWTIGDYFPILPGDELIVEGKFKNADHDVMFSISRSVITVGADYSLSFRAEEPVDLTIQAGMMSNHPNGWNTTNNTGLYFSMQSNDIPFSDDWKTYYYPTAAENIQLIRDGQTVNVAKTDREYIVKYQDTGYYLKLDKWCIGDYYPLAPGDVLIVEGKFENAVSGVVFNIDKTYITVGEGYVLTFSQEKPDVDKPEDTTNHGPMYANSDNGWTATGGLYFTMQANDLTYTTDFTTRFTPVSESCVKLIRGGQTYNVAHTLRETICKYSETNYYYEFWTLDTYKPVVAGDILIVEGDFINKANGEILSIAKTTITFNADGTATFESEQPDTPDVPDVPAGNPMAAHSVNGWTATGGLYFTMAANDAPYDGWNTRYTPTAATNVKLIRGGMTYDVGHTARETIVKYSDTEYYYEFWTLDTYKPVLAGDILVVEGDFVNTASGATLTVAKTTITFNADGTATFVSEGGQTPEQPDEPQPEEAGLPMLPWDEKAWNTDANNGFWFTMAENDIPADETWVLEYTPVTEDAIKLVRNGETVNIAIPGRGTLIKANDAEYYLKLDWNIGDYSGKITVGDKLIVEGNFTNADNGVTFQVAKTTITIGADYVLTFESEEAEEGVLNVGSMSENSSGISDNIIYFSLADNDLPYNLTKSDFRPASADTIQLIRDGQTYDVADPSAKTIVKQSAAKYRLLRGALTMDLQAGDILVVDGIFTGGNTNEDTVYTIRIARTYIFIGDGTVRFSTELSDEE